MAKTKMTKSACSGCEDNFYNGHNPYGVKECWCFKSAEIIQRKKIPIDQRPPWNHKPQKLPSCYRQKGYCILNGNPKEWPR